MYVTVTRVGFTKKHLRERLSDFFLFSRKRRRQRFERSVTNTAKVTHDNCKGLSFTTEITPVLRSYKERKKNGWGIFTRVEYSARTAPGFLIT